MNKTKFGSQQSYNEFMELQAKAWGFLVERQYGLPPAHNDMRKYIEISEQVTPMPHPTIRPGLGEPMVFRKLLFENKRMTFGVDVIDLWVLHE